MKILLVSNLGINEQSLQMIEVMASKIKSHVFEYDAIIDLGTPALIDADDLTLERYFM